MTIIDVSVNGKIAKASGNSVIVCDNTDYIVNFNFDDEWASEPVKTARFVWNGAFQDVVFSGNMCHVPKIQNTTIMGIGLYAGDLITTTAAYITVRASILDGSLPHPEPAPDVYEQILSLIEAGAIKGPKGDPGPTWRPTVDELGVISWTEDSSENPPEPRSIKGPKGDPGESADHEYISLERKGSYLYEITFDDIPEEKPIANSYGRCSSFVKDGKLHRNLDWKYSTSPDFIVKCNGFVGMSFLDQLIDGDLEESVLGQLPYHINDGVNDYGIMVSSHVIFNDWEWKSTGSIAITKLPYIILSTVKTLRYFDVQMRDVLANLSIPNDLVESEQLLQFMVTDGETTYVLAPSIDYSGKYEVIDATNNPKLTNFRWVPDTTVDRHSLQDRPNGVERWNNIDDSLIDLRFTKAYETPEWLSEFIGINDTTKDSSDETLIAIYNTAHQMYLRRERNGETWQTVHSVVYSKNGFEKLSVQENWEKDYFSGSSDALWLPNVDPDGVISWQKSDRTDAPMPRNIKGAQGDPGADGHTPVKGVDYFTDADISEIVADVLEALPMYEGGSY